MPVTTTYPGVYIEELPSTVRTITGVPTSIAAFAGWAPKGPGEAFRITSWDDYQRVFGGLHLKSPMSHAVYQFYLNGGSEAEIVRLTGTGAAASTLTLTGGPTLAAASPGVWGDKLRARVDHQTRDPGDTTLFNLTLLDTGTGTREIYLNISTVAADPRNIANVLQGSQLVRVSGAPPTTQPGAHDGPTAGAGPFDDGHPTWYAQGTGGADGGDLQDSDYLGDSSTTGIYKLEKTDIFNMLCLPGAGQRSAVLDAAVKLCVDRRAMLIVDPLDSWATPQAAADPANAHSLMGDDPAKNAAVYFPRVVMANLLKEGAVEAFPPCGVVAGVWARTDVQRGVWKAPAGTDATLSGVVGLGTDTTKLPITDGESGLLNPLGINCLRSMPVVGPVSWGARTMRGADRLADQWKYVPVRRLALFIEESLYRGTQWVVFEPNDEPLWSSIRLNVGAFMNTLFRQGAFQGRTPQQAYLVKCDATNNPQNDIDRGIVNILVGFAPLKPAEFVIIQLQQLAGQIQV